MESVEWGIIRIWLKSILLVVFLVHCVTMEDCCSPGKYRGCDDDEIEEKVCNVTEVCCEDEWAGDCVYLAKKYFPSVCPDVCGDGLCGEQEDCQVCSKDCGFCDSSSCLEDPGHLFFNDPLYVDQWHLVNHLQHVDDFQGTNGIDINVKGTWSSGFFGRNVFVAVVDDGVQWNHPDVQCNYQFQDSYDFDLESPNQHPHLWDDHGTACAGLIAGVAHNKVCGVGVAFLSKLAGIRLLGENFSDLASSKALYHRISKVGIYSNSWGPSDDGEALDRFPRALSMIHNGILKGRDGKGSIYVWAGGNGRMNGDDSNYDVLANSIYTIAVAASDWNGKYATYSERGSNIFVNAPSSSLLVNGTSFKAFSGITTIDRLGYAGYNSEGSCTDDFGGTSASCPIVAGVIALWLEIQPKMTWRDVQWLIVETSTKNDMEDPFWALNGAEYWFNPNYGFGRINVEKGRLKLQDPNWKTICPLETQFKHRWFMKHDIPSHKTDPLIYNYESSDLIVEHVVVKVTSQLEKRGSFTLTVQSPQNTLSILAPGRPNDNGTDYLRFPFMSVNFWGESAKGNWTIYVAHDSEEEMFGELYALQMEIYGFPPNCEEVKPPKPPSPGPERKYPFWNASTIKKQVLVGFLWFSCLVIVLIVLVETIKLAATVDSQSADLQSIIQEMMDQSDSSFPLSSDTTSDYSDI